VVNHGVSEQAMRDMVEVSKDFFELPMPEKADLYSEDASKENRLFSGKTYNKIGGERYWRDVLSLSRHFPVGDSAAEEWPDKPHSSGKSNFSNSPFPSPIPKKIVI
jgi:2'-deoxymugineic-acid 2'-dioxygenase/mugineic-acid 3-dioxygenase